MSNSLEMFTTDENGKKVISLIGLQQLAEYEPFFIIPKEANPRIVETETGDYDIVYDKAYPITVEWRKMRTKMTLDEAIRHCEEKEKEQALNGCFACAEEHKQLAEWLKELAYLQSSSSYAELTALRKFKAENEKPQGEWKEDAFCYICPFCGMSIEDEVRYLYPDNFDLNFCPNCGKKLRWKGEEE